MGRGRFINTLFLFFCFTISMSAQEITICRDNVKVRDAMQILQKDYGYSFSMAADLVDVEKVVKVDVKDAGVREVLEAIFCGQMVEFRIRGKIISVVKGSSPVGPRPENKGTSVNENRIQSSDPEDAPAAPSPSADVELSSPKNVRGTVLDENSLPITGATVQVDDRPLWVSTSSDGSFSIDIEADRCILNVSFLGYAPRKVVAEAGTQITVNMTPDISSSLNEVVVIGYGTVKKGDLTGSVSNVRLDDIKSDPVLSVDEALQGRIAGVDIMSTSGEPGAGTSIRIRGTRSITASNEPLIVVDGVIDAVNSINEINPADIGSLTVLKDASSTAIYGSRGSNGVIMITTKAGTGSRPSVIFKAEAGVSVIAKYLDTMDAVEFATYYNDYRYLTSYYFNSDADKKYSPIESYGGKFADPMSLGKGTDWLREITRVAPYQNYNLSISGKTGSLKYFASVGYTDKQGIVKASGIRRYSARMNIDYDVAKWISIGYRGSFSYIVQKQNPVNIGGTNFWNGAIYLNPILNPESVVNDLYNNSPRINNPSMCIKYIEKNQHRATQNHAAVFTVRPGKGWKIRSQNSYMIYQRHDYQFWPNSLPANTSDEGSTAYRYEGDAQKFATENTVSYDYTSVTKHHVDVMAGFTASRTIAHGLSLKAGGLLVEELKWGNMGGVTDKDNVTYSSNSSEVIRESVLFRANYNFRKKYYLTFTGRADASSNFASNNKWGFFPSGAFRWNIAAESWMRRVSWIDELSLRLSAGRTGNDAISAYRSLEAVSSTIDGYIFDGQQSVTYYPTRLANDDLTWEKTDSYNIAVDAAFFQERLRATVECYFSRTTDLLLTVQTGHVTGYRSRYENLGCTHNLGVEATIEGRIFDNRNFGWTSVLTLSHNRQMVMDIGEESRVIALGSPSSGYMMYGYKKGYPLNSLWGFKYAGVWHDREEIEQNKKDRAFVSGRYDPGFPKYQDINNDGSLSESDIVYQGTADPVIYGGWQNTFHIGRHLKASFLLNWSLGGKIYNYSETYMCGSGWTNQYRKMINSWHPVRNPDSDIPRAGCHNPMHPSDFMIYDASYLRLKSAALSYTFDLNKTKVMKDLTLTLSGENLFLISEYPGFDPDVSTESDSSTLRRVDLGAYPKARTYIMSVQFRF